MARSERPDRRVDARSGAPVVVTGDRQDRPNLPAGACPFCPGGLEAPEPYAVRSFVNRWPPLPDGRAEILLYSPRHDASLWSLGVDGARAVVDLWAERTAALGRRDDVAYVLVFAGLSLSSAGLYYGLDRRLTPKLGKLGFLASGRFRGSDRRLSMPSTSVPSAS